MPTVFVAIDEGLQPSGLEIKVSEVQITRCGDFATH
jgi:hypothetical protein